MRLLRSSRPLEGRSVEEVMRVSLAVSPQCGFASQSQGGGCGYDGGEAVGEIGLFGQRFGQEALGRTLCEFAYLLVVSVQPKTRERAPVEVQASKCLPMI